MHVTLKVACSNKCTFKQCYFHFAGVLSNVPTLKQLNRFNHRICPHWFDLGLQLLSVQDCSNLQTIHDNYHNYEQCCSEMFRLWLETSSPSWEALIDALKSIELNEVVYEIEMAISGMYIMHTYAIVDSKGK